MTETKKITVPEGMLDAAHWAATRGRLNGSIMTSDTLKIVEAALLWLSKNPMTREGDE
jgi:hypothetical protein